MLPPRPRLIERDRELARLTAALARAEAGTPAALFLTGEAGVGKTRLLREFGERAEAKGVRMWTGRCLPAIESLIPYVPFVDLLHGIAADVGVDELRALAGATAGWLSALAPELATEAPPAADRGRLHAAWWHLIERLAVKPVVLALEDLHWADPSSRELIAGLASAQRRGRLLVVGTYRDDDLPAAHPLRTLVIELVRSGTATHLRLGPLSREGTTEQIADLLGRDPEPDVAERIFVRTGGNPFFVEELLASGSRCGAPDLPESLRDAVLHRVRHLPDAVRGILRAVALASHDVEHVLLDEMLGLPREALHSALRLAVDRQLLVVHGTRYAFRHSLFAEAVLADLLPGELLDLHRCLVTALESRACFGVEVAVRSTLVHGYVPWDLVELYERVAARRHRQPGPS